MKDSTTIITTLIAAVVSLATLYVAWSSGRRAAQAAERAAAKAEGAETVALITATKLDEVATNVDGKLKDLVRATGAEKLAEGEAIGRKKNISEKADRTAEAERVEDRHPNSSSLSPDDIKLIATAVAEAISSGAFPKVDSPSSKEKEG